MGRYEVHFHVILHGWMDHALVIEKANRIAVPGSAEAEAFAQVLMATDGVAKIHQIVLKVPAKVIDEALPTTNAMSAEEADDEKSWVSVVIGAGVGLAALSCLVAGIVRIMYKRAPIPTAAAQSTEADSESRPINGNMIVPSTEANTAETAKTTEGNSVSQPITGASAISPKGSAEAVQVAEGNREPNSLDGVIIESAAKDDPISSPSMQSTGENFDANPGKGVIIRPSARKHLIEL